MSSRSTTRSSGISAVSADSRMLVVAVSKPPCTGVENHAHYAGLDDVFGIAATYATAIARGHVFNDANKRTGLTCALTYMERQGISISRLADLEDLMVDVADGSVTSEELAEYFSAIWELSLSR
ncbi:death-on-curing family protein [Burkholderia stabilis]|uniref:Death-on-curing family protein n=2 Tax=Burkholderia stabilis TaxID=95485 RepID=A0AAJ5N3F4_9BURK|nr:death-on-curing family protein [Burkholderia stabilis]